MAAAVLTATAGGFAQSYAGLYHWALEHGLRGWKAESFPLLVDLFIIVGELGLFLLAIDAFVLRRRALMSWLDFFLPLTIALAGWTASLVFNVGHVGHKTFSYQATAAVPPIVSMLGLFVLLRTLHRYVQQDAEDKERTKQPEPQTRAIAGPVTLNQITLMPLRNTGPFPQIQVPGHSGKAIESGTSATAAASATTASATTGTGTAAKPQAEPAETTGTTGEAKAAPPDAPAPQPARAQDSAPASAEASAPAPAPAPAPVPEPEPELAVVSAAARGSLNGHSSYVPAPEQTAPAPSPDPEGLRNFVIDVLERRHGDVPGTLAEVRAEGYTCDEAEIQRISDNHWFPYAVYRLLAKHHGNGELVAAELRAQGIVYDQAMLDELVRSWRV
ncbi:DUF2637 domain-containing protein [Actinomadura sp. KC345]|uniref:DUF2637 domain-containing protein n=1 Tax=Actinomadura sp. KC345 TaxID=2530371 RepID=UPI001404D33F|nr:DUF2637 domain-containing protein [Actinomadura sp. KC345]